MAVRNHESFVFVTVHHLAAASATHQGDDVDADNQVTNIGFDVNVEDISGKPLVVDVSTSNHVNAAPAGNLIINIPAENDYRIDGFGDYGENLLNFYQSRVLVGRHRHE